MVQHCSNKCEKHEFWQRYIGQYAEKFWMLQTEYFQFYSRGINYLFKQQKLSLKVKAPVLNF